jgi:hypothetical protein
VMPISVPVDSDQGIGAERRWQSDCVGSDRNRQEEVGSERGFGAKRRWRDASWKRLGSGGIGSAGRAGIWGGRGKGAAFEPLYPPHLHFEKKR